MSARSRSRSLRGLLIIGVLFGVVASGLSQAVAVAPVRRSSAPPTSLPTDPHVNGYIGLCDEAGHNVVGGDIRTKPFAWKAVSSAAPPAGYQGVGQNAVLNAYQPRPDTLPGDWSGAALTAASFYSNKAKPAVQATYADLSLADFMATYPAKSNGLYVLRFYWGKSGYGLYSGKYPATVIQVQGSHWHVVSGGTVDCGVTTKAVSMEQLTGVATKQDITPRAPAKGQTTVPAGGQRRIVTAPVTVGRTGDGAVAGVAGAAAAAGGTAARGSTAAASSSSSSSASHSSVMWTLLAAVALLAAALAFSVRRRRPAPTADTSLSSFSDDPKD